MRLSTLQIHQSGLTGILDQQSRLHKTQQQLATGRKNLSAADNPTATVQAMELRKTRDNVQQFQTNITHARNRLQLEESVLASVTNNLQRVREQAVAAGSGTLSPENRRQIAIEIEQLLEELVGLANSRDGGGEYLFSGYRTDQAPFEAVNDGFAYRGDHGQRLLQVGFERQIAVGDSGFDVFVKLPSANQVWTPADEPDPGDPPPDPAGTWGAAGGYQDLFSSVQQFAGDLRANLAPYDGRPLAEPDDPTQTHTRADVLSNLDTALNKLSEVRAEVGARLNALDSQEAINDSFEYDLTATLSTIEDLDYAEAITRLNRYMLGLEAAQQSYMRLQGLSLFNYL